MALPPSEWALALFLTLAIELAVAIAFGFRTRRELSVVALVNIITNPALNFFLMAAYNLALIRPTLSLILFLELLVVITELFLLAYTLRKKPVDLLLMVAIMNGASFLAGIAINPGILSMA